MKFKQEYMLPLMAEEGGDNPTGGGDTPPAEPTPSGLPSDNQPLETTFEIKPEDLTDGKFQGKWDNPQQMADYIKTIEDKHSALNRQIADDGKKSDAELEQMSKDAQTAQLQEDTVKTLLPEFLKNGMVVTPEMQEELKKTGLTEQDIKLGAYEFKESIDLNASYVGGKENYDIIMNHHAEKMTDDEKRAFNHSIQDPKNSEALMVGLQTMYEKSVGATTDDTPQDRVRGNPTQNNAIKPYASKGELLRDKRYADSNRATSADKARFRQRLTATPDNVWKN